jgi:NAD(P)-dependent dehydrogenase (short-subunit alcohol dehydrogenase family)
MNAREKGRVAGKVALVTGAARGQGAAHAERLAAEGAAVLLTDVLDELGEATAERIRAAGGDAAYRHLDVGSESEWAAAAAAAGERFGPVTVLVNNAGIATRAGILDTDAATWERSVAVNQRGVFLGMKACLPAMIGAGTGSIVNVSSVLGISGAAGYASYQATKHAVIGLTRSAARSHGPDGVRANVICPGYIVTPMSQENPVSAQEALIAQVPLGRAAAPEEVASLVLFLASEESSYISGAQIPIDGGLLA